MSDFEKRKKRLPLKPPSPEKFQPRVVLIWLAIFAAILALWWANPETGSKVTPMTMKQAIEAAERGEIVKGEVKADGTGGPGWHVIRGQMRNTVEPGGPPVEFRAEGRLTEDSFTQLQNTGAVREVPASSAWQQILISILPFILIIGLLYFLFVRQIRMAGRGALNFGKSRAKLLTRDRDRLTFSDVAGCDEAKEEVQEIVEFLKDPKKFQKVGGRIPKGILMVGPPGTGKTLLAKAIAGEADVPFFSISGSDFVEMFVGVGASRVRDMFEQGRKNAPCLIFIDEIDAVGRQRGAGLGGGNDEREQTLNSLLVEMDGFDTNEGVIIIAATNRPDVLDNALLRPGRFDRQVYIDLPDLVGREQVLRVHARKLPLSDDVDLSVVARGTPGLSGADLANLLNESALLAARRNKKKISMVDIEDAREKVLFGRERRRVMEDDEKLAIAWHETGHAIVRTILDDGTVPVHKVTVIPRGQSLGSVTFFPTKDVLTRSKQSYLNEIASALGGRIAEKLHTNEISSGASSDIRRATQLARSMVCDFGMSELGPVSFGEKEDTIFLGREITRSHNMSEATSQKIDAEVSRIISEQYARAEEIINKHRDAVAIVAAALMEHETIEGKHVKEILEHGAIKSAVIKATLYPADDAARERKAASDKSRKEDEIPPSTEPTGAPA